LGALIVERLLEHALASGGRAGSIGLTSAYGKGAFYERFGFIARPDSHFGAGMTWVDANACA
jgi:predicted N-acetyltransferase YhbS